ncbi:hypothetical protein P7K49_039004 [Saguinus oedipus]|uniref:Transmembrane protein 255A n=1 Tax=Saguinus oedipus TaxID=9490 RepID=A0ABQ9TH58_SAGOE|nr:hypothetical protein P7K49_039004 [Saguinus oedipus]
MVELSPGGAPNAFLPYRREYLQGPARPATALPSHHPGLLGAFNRRKRNSIYVTVTLLIVSVLILTVGLAATTRTQNVTVGGYYPGVILGFGSFLGIIGSNLIENKRQMGHAVRFLHGQHARYQQASSSFGAHRVNFLAFPENAKIASVAPYLPPLPIAHPLTLHD